MLPKIAVILAGGLGTRLRSIVSNVPKSLAPIHDEPFLFLLLRALARLGVSKIILLTGYLHEQIVAVCGDGSIFGLELIYSYESEPLGTAGALKNAEKYLTDVSDFLLLNGDSFCPEAITALSTAHDLTKRLGVIAVTQVENSSRFGTVSFDPRTLTVLSFEEKGSCKTGYVNTGVYRLSNKILREIPANRQCSLEQEIFPKILSALSVSIVDASFDDIGIPESYHSFLKKTKVN